MTTTNNLLATLTAMLRQSRAGHFVPYAETVGPGRDLYAAPMACWGLVEGYQPFATDAAEIPPVLTGSPAPAPPPSGPNCPFRLFEDDEIDFHFPENLPLWSPV